MASMNAAGHFLRDLWRLARPYWFSEERWAARGLAVTIVGMSLAIVALNVRFNKWYNDFYNTLQNYAEADFWRQLEIFSGLAAVFIVIRVFQTYLQQMLIIRWRRWLTERYIADWLEGQVYYGLQMRSGTADNPDQRISEDVNQFINSSLNLTLNLIETIVSLVSFSVILWGLSGHLKFTLFGHAIAVPGDLLWLALIYAIVGSWLTQKVGRPLASLNYNQQRFEADFRFSMARFRENVEGVALYHGEVDENEIFKNRFSRIWSNYWDIMRRQRKLNFLVFGYSQAAVVFPYIAAAPQYFSKAIPLGGLMQVASAFGHVQGAMSWFVNAYTDLASWKATIDRLTSFHEAVASLRIHDQVDPGIVREASDFPELVTSGLDLSVPDGSRSLIEGASISIKQGDTVLIRGPSGAGKSSLFRAIAGLWHAGGGRISLPNGRMMFLPQKPYLPIGSLRSCVCYPAAPDAFDDGMIAEALAACGLSRLSGQFEDTHYWAQTLSPGEQQRLAFVRVLLHKPDWVFLDEASSALDEEDEAELYRLLEKKLPGITLVSIGHRSTLATLHKRQFELKRDGNGVGHLTAVAVPAAE